MSREKRNIAILTLSQALFTTNQVVLIILSGLVGKALAQSKALATLPVSVVIIGIALTTIPASMMMQRVGRRVGFMFASGVAITGAAICSLAIWYHLFWLFVVGTGLFGVSGGFAMYYRFAAVDGVTEKFRAKAISLVVSGGIAGALFGPELAKWSNGLFASVDFLGTYVMLMGTSAAAMVVLAFVDIPKPAIEHFRGTGRPLLAIMKQPTFMVAALCAMIGYGVMSLVMTAAPLAMVDEGFSVNDAAFVIQWHALAMFAPSLITGTLMDRFGVLKIILCGVVLLFACVGLGLFGLDLHHFWLSQFALGLGWNFTFVGGSALLIDVYRPEERARVQAANDFLVFGTTAIASLSSGVLLYLFGWNVILIVSLPFTALAGVAVIWLMSQRRKAGASMDNKSVCESP